PHRLRWQAVDDAAVCRVRHAGRDQRALQGTAACGRHRTERRLRSADVDGSRSRPRAVARRSGEVRRQHRLARGHGGALCRDPAVTLRDGLEYVQWGMDAGLAVDAFVPRLSFFFNAHSDFFEEIAKYRAARRIWARELRDRFGAASERSWKMRFHTQTAGVSLTAQQPYNNVVRTALQALSAVIGGTNSLHTNSLDEALALPTEEAATLALRTQQILAFESGGSRTVDPLGGSYFVERLTGDMEAEALD